MVQSARVQQIVKGDSALLTHQIMKAVAYNAELARMPDPLNEGDSVNFFYPLEDPTQTDLIGYPGAQTTVYPCSIFTVAIPSVIIDPNSLLPNRGTSTFLSGPGQTVRAEINRFVVQVTGNTHNGTNVIDNLSTTVGLAIGQIVSGPNILPNTVVEAIDGSTIIVSQNSMGTSTGGNLSFGVRETQYMIAEVDVYERGFPVSLNDTSGGVNPPPAPLNLP